MGDVNSTPSFQNQQKWIPNKYKRLYSIRWIEAAVFYYGTLWFQQSEMQVASPTEIFLNFLTYPEDPNTLIDLRMSAVVMMSHLDRLALPYLQPSSSQKVR